MFLLEDKQVQNILKKYLHFTDEQVVEMLRDYAEGIQALMIDQCFIYLDEKKLREEEAYIDELTEETSDERLKYENLKKLYQFLFELPTKYADLYTRIRKEVSKYNKGFYAVLKDTLPEDAIVEIFEIAGKDIKDIRKLAKTYEIPL